jgi:hypothetical protein
MKPVVIIVIAIVFVIGMGLSINVSAESNLVPSWIRNSVSFWIQGEISDKEFLDSMAWLISKGIMTVSANPSSFSSYIIEEKSNVGSSKSTDPTTTESVWCNSGDTPLAYGAYGESRRNGYVLTLMTNAQPSDNGFEITVHNLTSESGEVHFWITCLKQ